MKAESYDALAALNRGFDAALESLRVLQEQGVLSADYVQDETPFIEERRAGLNHMILDKLEARETEDWEHFGKMRDTIEERRRDEATTPTTTGDSGTDASRENGSRTQDGSESVEG